MKLFTEIHEVLGKTYNIEKDEMYNHNKIFYFRNLIEENYIFLNTFLFIEYKKGFKLFTKKGLLVSEFFEWFFDWFLIEIL